MPTPVTFPTLFLALALPAMQCSRHAPDGAQSAQSAPAPAVPSGASGAPTEAHMAIAAPPVAPQGPRAELAGDHYAFVANLGAPPALPGDTSLTVEVRGATGYHVNQLYPVALDLTPTNATAPAQLRRADAAELTQQLAAFHVPVHVNSAGAIVRGTLRFAVCSDENCVPQSQAFAVALP